jgi:hypothetical protein
MSKERSRIEKNAQKTFAKEILTSNAENYELIVYGTGISHESLEKVRLATTYQKSSNGIMKKRNRYDCCGIKF